MGVIKKLDPLEARKIAAGEVIERPVNIIKELVENSIDAQATKISIDIKSGGLEYISITDNGCGILKEDLPAAFEHHSTSKINCLEDLWQINSLGFRGEALSSIAAVSDVTVHTKHQDEQKATSYKIGPTIEAASNIVSAPQGTTIIIENLFETIPARKKFQKSPETEYRLIQNLILNISLAYPHIFFELKHNERTSLQLTSCSEEERILNALDLKKDNLSKIDLTRKDIELTGWFSSPEVSRYNRQGITVFVNNRPVKNSNLVKAIIRGYGNMLADKKFPYAVIKINIAPNSIDMNVHPKKEEIRFSKENEILSLITEAASKSVQARSQQNLTTQVTNSITYSPQPAETYFRPEIKTNTVHTNAYPSTPNYIPKISDSTTETYQQTSSFNIENKTEETITINFLGQLEQTYLLFESPEGLLILDQHAAHERVIYESIEKQFGNPVTIALLFPLTIKLDNATEWFIQNCELFNQLGIKYDQLTNDTLAIKEIPLFLKNKRIDEIFHEVASHINEYNSTAEDIALKLRHLVQSTIACKAAIKAGDNINSYEAKKLLVDLRACRQSASCPHGRPTSFVYKIKDIAKEFRRFVKEALIE